MKLKYFKEVRRIFTLALGLLVLAGCQKHAWKNQLAAEYTGEFTWTQVNKKADWPKRWNMGATAFDGKLWVMGGYNPGMRGGDTYLEDVWSSEDGKTWTQVTDAAPWFGRRGHSVVTFNDGCNK